MSFGRKLKECRDCESKNLHEFLDLGFAPPADRILDSEEIEQPEILFPLKVMQCQDCGLTQLKYAASPNILYGEQYRYESSITETGKRHFYEMADSIFQRFKLNDKSLVVDIGSNVGILLERLKEKGIKVLGIEPAPKIAKIANERGIESWKKFISPEVAKKIVHEKGKADLVTATNVFAHIDNKEALMRSLETFLHEDGVFIIEAPYFVDLVENMEYDTIYLDHLEYLSVKPLVNFFNRWGMDVFDVEKYDIHGKSIRIFTGKKGKRRISENVGNFLKTEEEKGIYKKEVLNDFSCRVKQHREKFTGLLRDLKRQGKSIVGISSPAKGNTLLNYCRIGTEIIDYMVEKSVIKQWCYTPGMHIPICEEERLLKDKPDYGIVFAWNFAEEIMRNNQQFKENGGRFIIPIPNPVII